MNKMLILAGAISTISGFSTTVLAANEQGNYRGYQSQTTNQQNRNANSEAFIQGVAASTTQDTSYNSQRDSQNNSNSSSNQQNQGYNNNNQRNNNVGSNSQNTYGSSNNQNQNSYSNNNQRNANNGSSNQQSQGYNNDNQRNNNVGSNNQRNNAGSNNQRDNNAGSNNQQNNNQRGGQASNNRTSNGSTSTQERAFLSSNARQLGVITTSSGLQYKVNKAGLGRMPRANDTVRVSYEARLADGTLVEQEDSRLMHLSKFVPGVSEGIQTMRERGKARFFVPSKLAYGDAGLGNSIPPNSTLIYDVELIKVD